MQASSRRFNKALPHLSGFDIFRPLTARPPGRDAPGDGPRADQFFKLGKMIH